MKAKTVNVLIIDDEKPARQKIRSYLKEEETIRTISEAANGIEAVQLIREKQPGIVFLDIQMPGMNGFEVIETVGVEHMPVVVFVTAYDQYAIDAFEVQAVDYLLKPYHQERFKKSFNRALDQVQQARQAQSSPVHDSTAVMKKLLEEINKEKKYLQRIMVKKGPRYFFVKTADIRYISAEEKYIKLHSQEESYLVRDALGRIQQRLDPEKFVRIHRSYIVNLEFIKEVQPWSHGDYVVILEDGTRLSLSRRFSERLLSR